MRGVSDQVHLDAAYRRTTYWIETPHRYYAIRIDEHHPELDEFLSSHGPHCWAVITAFNPDSQLLSPPENQVLAARLARAVEAVGFESFVATGAGWSGDWPPESGLLIVGIAEANARDLARKFQQKALVFGESGCRARLLWTDDWVATSGS